MLRWRDGTIKERRVRGGRWAVKGMIANACPTHVVDGAIAGKYDRYGEPARRGKFQDPVSPRKGTGRRQLRAAHYFTRTSSDPVIRYSESKTDIRT